MKEKDNSDFYRQLTRFYGFCIWALSSIMLTSQIINSSLSIPSFLLLSTFFFAGRYIQKTAYQD